MAGQLSKEKLGSVVMHAMLAKKNLRYQRDRLLQLRRRLQQPPSPSDDYGAAGLSELAQQVEHIDPTFADRLQELAVKQMGHAVTVKQLTFLLVQDRPTFSISPVPVCCFLLEAECRELLRPGRAERDELHEQGECALVAERGQQVRENRRCSGARPRRQPAARRDGCRCVTRSGGERFQSEACLLGAGSAGFQDAAEMGYAKAASTDTALSREAGRRSPESSIAATAETAAAEDDAGREPPDSASESSAAARETAELEDGDKIEPSSFRHQFRAFFGVDHII